MNVIFLDIDGVLNVENDLLLRIKRNQPTMDKYGHLFCPSAVEYLKYIINEFDAKIVISSSWRWNGIKEMQNLWRDRNLPGWVIDVTYSWTSTNIEEQNRLRPSSMNRGQEIELYLDTHPGISNYVIFDDDTDMTDRTLPHLVKCDPRYGITCTQYYEAENIFTNV